MTSNEIGNLGEIIFNLAISRGYIFRPMHLGEKWPTSDYYVELIGTTKTYYFIVQIKATTRGYDKKKKHLKIQAGKDKVNRLNGYFAPTYIAGVDVKDEKVYLMSVNKNKRKNINKISTKFGLNSANLQKLFDDVKEFWNTSKLDVHKHSFKHKIK